MKLEKIWDGLKVADDELGTREVRRVPDVNPVRFGGGATVHRGGGAWVWHNRGVTVTFEGKRTWI